MRQAHAELERSLGVFVYIPDGSGARWERVVPGAKLPSEAVLLIHGLDEGGTIWDDAAPALASAGHSPLRFNYRNDQPIALSSNALASALVEMRLGGVERVTLVGHSMGALVARDVLTRAEHYNSDPSGGDSRPRVARLIMLGPPNHGSPLAPLRGVMEIRDQFTRWIRSEGSDSGALLGFLADGRGEAANDLSPGSAFLRELNARPLPAGLPTTIVVGEIASDGKAELREALDTAFAKRVLGEDRAGALAGALRQAGDALGDGCVPASSALLEGVDDVVHVEADHRSMIKRLSVLDAARRALGRDAPPPPAIAVILERLGRE